MLRKWKSIVSWDDSPDAGDEMISEVTVTADKEDMMLTVQCSLGSEDLFSIDKFMQFDVQCKFIIQSAGIWHQNISLQMIRHVKATQLKYL